MKCIVRLNRLSCQQRFGIGPSAETTVVLASVVGGRSTWYISPLARPGCEKARRWFERLQVPRIPSRCT